MSLLEITNLSHSFSENVLYKNADFSLNKGEHVKRQAEKYYFDVLFP